MRYDGPSAKPHDSGIAVGIIVARGGKVLLLKRSGTATGHGTWCIPGGAVEFQEDPSEAAARELKEETGLVATDFEMLGYSNDVHKKESLHYVTFTMMAKNFSGRPRNLEPHKCSAVDWFDIDKLPSPLFEPTAKKLTPESVKNKIRNSK